MKRWKLCLKFRDPFLTCQKNSGSGTLGRNSWRPKAGLQISSKSALRPTWTPRSRVLRYIVILPYLRHGLLCRKNRRAGLWLSIEKTCRMGLFWDVPHMPGHEHYQNSLHRIKISLVSRGETREKYIFPDMCVYRIIESLNTIDNFFRLPINLAAKKTRSEDLCR